MFPTPRILPTPQARDFKNSNTTTEITPRMQRKLEQGWTIDLNNLIALTPLNETTETIGPTNGIKEKGLSSFLGNKITDTVLRNLLNSTTWGSAFVNLQWVAKPLYMMLRKNDYSKSGKKQFSLLYQLTPIPIDNSQSELLPTPNTMEGLEPKSKESILAYNAKARPGRSYATSNLRERLAHGKMEKEMALLPTPCSQESGNNPKTYIDGRRPSGGSDFGMGLSQKLATLPTPTTDNGHERSDEYYRNRKGKHQVDLQGEITMLSTALMISEDGQKTGMRLQPSFALWMMGFPTDYLDLP